MKILYLTTHLNRGGISQYIFSVGSALLQKGHEVFVASSGGEMEEEFGQKGFGLRTFPIRTKSELSLKLYRSLPALIRCVQKEGIDLVHAHTRVTQVMAQWVEWITGTPFVTTAHGFYKRRLGRRLIPCWGKRVVAISEGVGTHLKETFRVPLNRLRVVFNGIDLEDLSKRFLRHDSHKVKEEYGIPENAFVLGITARLVSDKGHEYLMRAMKLLQPEIENLHLLIVGNGRHLDYLQELSRALDLLGQVHFLGTLGDVTKPLRAMDLFVLPATWREGFGLSIVEAMACEKPVIVTNIWALNTLIQDRVNGILVEPRNVPALAEAICLVLKDSTLRERIAKAGRRTAQESFSLDRMVRELETVYEEVLGR